VFLKNDPSKREAKSRSESGNIFFTSLLVIVPIILSALVASTFWCAPIMENDLAVQTDRLNLILASYLNKDDRQGRLNNMLAASRQLVLISRLNYNEAIDNCPVIAPFATRLLEEAREGAKLVGKERNQIHDLILADVKTLTEENTRRADIYPLKDDAVFLLPWLRCHRLSIESLTLGYVEGINSNVQATKTNPELMAIDKRFIDANTGLYYANISLPLPGPDSDLKFELSSVTAPIKGKIPESHQIKDRSCRKLWCRTLKMLAWSMAVGL